MKNIPYSRQNLSDGDVDAVIAALRSAYLTQGPAVPDFEAAFAKRHEVAHAVAVCNATAALHIACLSLGAGPGSRVWTSPNSFVASANCALYCGAEVDFVDIEVRTRNLSAEALESKLKSAKARNALPHIVIPVDFAGFPCDWAEFRMLADKYGFRLLQDASHATGASYRGRPVGAAYADATVFSFHAVKIITSAEGGMITTQDPSLARKLQLLRSHGITRDSREMSTPPHGDWYYEQILLGFNYRLTDLQAALGRSQLARLDEMMRKRIRLADRYAELLKGLPVVLPASGEDRQSAWHLYPVEIDLRSTATSREEIFREMRRRGVGVNVHYIPIHLQPYFRALGFKSGDFPASETYYERALSIPLHPALTDEEQDYVVEQMSSVLNL